MINDGAVEAAAEAIHFRHGLGIDESELVAKTALEAAHISAGRAWDEGWSANTSWYLYIEMGGDEPDSTNPYRSGT